MPSGNDYIPNTDEALVTWFANFYNKVVQFATAFGLTLIETNNVKADSETLAWSIALAAQFTAEAKERTQYKKTLISGKPGTVAPPVPSVTPLTPPAVIAPPGIVARARALAARLKAHPAYTLSMGKDLRIVVEGEPTPGTPSKPTGSAMATTASRVEIKFVKGGFEGVFIEGQRAGETVWANIGFATRSPFVDARAALTVGTPETRRYRLQYFKANTAVGTYSDVLTVVTVP